MFKASYNGAWQHQSHQQLHSGFWLFSAKWMLNINVDFIGIKEQLPVSWLCVHSHVRRNQPQITQNNVMIPRFVFYCDWRNSSANSGCNLCDNGKSNSKKKFGLFSYGCLFSGKQRHLWVKVKINEAHWRKFYSTLTPGIYQAAYETTYEVMAQPRAD